MQYTACCVDRFLPWSCVLLWNVGKSYVINSAADQGMLDLRVRTCVVWMSSLLSVIALHHYIKV